MGFLLFIISSPWISIRLICRNICASSLFFPFKNAVNWNYHCDLFHDHSQTLTSVRKWIFYVNFTFFFRFQKINLFPKTSIFKFLSWFCQTILVFKYPEAIVLREFLNWLSRIKFGYSPHFLSILDEYIKCSRFVIKQSRFTVQICLLTFAYVFKLHFMFILLLNLIKMHSDKTL